MTRESLIQALSFMDTSQLQIAMDLFDKDKLESQRENLQTTKPRVGIPTADSVASDGTTTTITKMSGVRIHNDSSFIEFKERGVESVITGNQSTISNIDKKQAVITTKCISNVNMSPSNNIKKIQFDSLSNDKNVSSSEKKIINRKSKKISSINFQRHNQELRKIEVSNKPVSIDISEETSSVLMQKQSHLMKTQKSLTEKTSAKKYNNMNNLLVKKLTPRILKNTSDSMTTVSSLAIINESITDKAP